jgi:hypothetical protein
VPEKLLQELLSHSFVGELLGDGVLQKGQPGTLPQDSSRSLP